MVIKWGGLRQILPRSRHLGTSSWPKLTRKVFKLTFADQNVTPALQYLNLSPYRLLVQFKFIKKRKIKYGRFLLKLLVW